MREVYFVEGAGLIKIGSSSSAILRFNNMLTTSAVPLSLLASMPCSPGDENKLHRQFAGQRSHGEWFHPSPELAAVIAAASDQYDEQYRNVLAHLPHNSAPRRQTPKEKADKLTWEQRIACLYG